jgi:predicted transcriptional regulator
MSATATTDIRGRRRRLGITRLALALRTGISTTHLAEIEGGSRPRGTALARVLDELDRLEAADAPLEAA